MQFDEIQFTNANTFPYIALADGHLNGSVGIKDVPIMQYRSYYQHSLHESRQGTNICQVTAYNELR